MKWRTKWTNQHPLVIINNYTIGMARSTYIKSMTTNNFHNNPHIDMKSSNQADRVTNSMSKTYNQVSVKDSFLIHTQGSIAYINLRTKKERTNRSSMAFFDLGEKKPVSYNLKHWFRYNFNMERVTSKLNTNSPAAQILQKYQLRSKLFMSNPLVDPHKVDRVSSILNSESQNSISLP